MKKSVLTTKKTLFRTKKVEREFCKFLQEKMRESIEKFVEMLDDDILFLDNSDPIGARKIRALRHMATGKNIKSIGR